MSYNLRTKVSPLPHPCNKEKHPSKLPTDPTNVALKQSIRLLKQCLNLFDQPGVYHLEKQISAFLVKTKP